MGVVASRGPSAYYSKTNPPPDDVDPLALTAYQPTVSVIDPATGFLTTSTLASSTYLAYNDTRLTYRGTLTSEMAVGTAYPQTLAAMPSSVYPHAYFSQVAYSVEFMMDGQAFELSGSVRDSQAAYRLLVNGRRVTDAAVQFAADAVDQHDHRLRFDFGSAKPRRITLELFYVPLFGIWAQGAVWKVPTYRDRTLVLGDSISGGSGVNSGSGIGTWVHRAALTLGWDDPWNQSIGGTGYITPGTAATFQTRVTTDVINYAPTRVIVWGGYNDASGTQATISTAATTLYQAIKAGAPTAEIIVIGCYSPVGAAPATLVNTDETLRVAAAGAGLPFISPITGKVYNARGTQVSDQGAFITSQNQATYVSSGDGVHPNDAGHNYLAGRIASAIKALYSSITSLEPWAGGLHAALDDGRPSNDKEWNYLSGPSTLATLTPTLLTTTTARCWTYNCQFPIVVNRLRWYGIGATTVHRLAVYRQADGVQVIGPLSLTTTADAWNSAAVPAVTLAPNTVYIVALSATTTGTTAGLRTGGTPLLYPPLQAATPGGLALTVGDHRFWFGQFTVTSGVLPATLPTLVRGTGWTAGLPLFFFDSNNAA